MKDKKKPPTWPDDIYEVFKEVGIRQVAYVPDAGHTQLIKRCHADRDMQTVSLTTEEEGVAMLAGTWLGGQRGVLLLQSSGVGNCINLLSIMNECRFPLLMIVTMRGEWGEFNPWQIAMGQGTPPALQNAGVEPTPGRGPKETAAFIQAELAKWGPIIRASGAQVTN